MIYRVILIFGISIGIQVVLVSCFGCGNNSNGGTFYYTLTAIDSKAVYDFKNQVDISDGDSIVSDSLLIKLNIGADMVASIFNRNNIGFIQSAYACEEMLPVVLLTSKIKSFTIMSNQPFLNHPANYDLAAYATIGNEFVQNNEHSFSIPEFINYLEEFFVERPDENYIIYLNTKPENNLYHKFTIAIETEDGQILSSQTQKIKWR